MVLFHLNKGLMNIFKCMIIAKSLSYFFIQRALNKCKMIAISLSYFFFFKGH